jgi:hypothetical protein
MAGGALLFDHETSDTVLKALHDAHRKAHREARKLASTLGNDGSRALVQAVSNGVFLSGHQLVPPTSAYDIKEFPVQPRNGVRAG